MGNPFDGNQLLSLQGCDLDTAKAIFKAHENVFNRLPVLRGQLNSINAQNCPLEPMPNVPMGWAVAEFL